MTTPPSGTGGNSRERSNCGTNETTQEHLDWILPVYGNHGDWNASGCILQTPLNRTPPNFPRLTRTDARHPYLGRILVLWYMESDRVRCQ
jgi:hypothetical protein